MTLIFGQKNVEAAPISNIMVTDELAVPLIVHETEDGQKTFFTNRSQLDEYKKIVAPPPESPPQFLSNSSSSSLTLQRDETTEKVIRTLRAECSTGNVDITRAQAKSENPKLEVESNIPKLKVTSSDLDVSVEAPEPEFETKTRTRTITWTITVKNKGNRAAKNVDVIATFSTEKGNKPTLDKIEPKGFELSDSQNDSRVVTWSGSTLDRLEADDTITFTVKQALEGAEEDVAIVEVTAKSNCDCDNAREEVKVPPINYAMVVELTDRNDPFTQKGKKIDHQDPQPIKEDGIIHYDLKVCNQVRPEGNDRSAFKFSFNGSFIGPEPAATVPDAVDSYQVKLDYFTVLNEYDETESRESHLAKKLSEKDSPHYKKAWEKWKEYRKYPKKEEFKDEFEALLKGRHCVVYDVEVVVNKELLNGQYQLEVVVEADIKPELKATETEPTTVER